MSQDTQDKAAPLYLRVYGVGLRFGRGLMAHNAFETAASIAFWFFLSLVPLLVLLGFLLGQVARSKGVDSLIGPALDIVPGTAENLVRKEIERLAGATVSSLAPLGVAGYFWTASSGLHNLMDVFEIAVKVERRPWWKKRCMALAWVVLGLGAMCLLGWLLVSVDAAIQPREPTGTASTTASVGSVTTTATPAGSGAPSWAPAPAPSQPSGARGGDHAPRPLALPPPARTQHGALRRHVVKIMHTPLEQLLAAALMLAIGTVFLAGFYRFAVVHPSGVRRRVWPGTLTAVGLWLIVSYAFGEYVVSLGNYALYYGSLAAVAVLLIWLYLTSLSLVFGAEVNAQLEGVRQ
jgi:uncharacterized BrkB/YihY/UPF0761 family membrane protein